MKQLRAVPALACALAIMATGCVDPLGPPIVFDPNSVELPDARPDFTSSAVVQLQNTSGSTYQLTALALTPGNEDEEGVFSFVLPQGITLPHSLPPGTNVEVSVLFAPLTLSEYQADLRASMWIEDFSVGGGGCSAGCGEDAPESSEHFVVAVLRGQGSNDATFEDCTDGIDNDGDGDVDCADSDCLTHEDCINIETICDDGIDNDEDGLTDCNDPDCFGSDECGGPSEICDDGVDNDGDGRVDCEDPDCFGDPACSTITGCEVEDVAVCTTTANANSSDGASNWIDYCGAGYDGWSGPEEVWSFAPDSTGEYSLKVVAEWDVDITLLAAIRQGETLLCEPTSCVGTSWSPPEAEAEVITTELEAGQIYFLVIDGWDGQSGDYSLDVTCPQVLTETDCDDEIDNDGDGRIDCDDPDCDFSPDCITEGPCAVGDSVLCSLEYLGSNDASSATNSVLDWCNEGFFGWSGPEVVYLFEPSNTGEVQVTMADLSADLDLTVLLMDQSGGDSGACNPAICVEWNWDGGTGDETVTFSAFAGTSYLIAIDGWDGAVSPFSLNIDCEGDFEIETDCEDGVDNDADGDIDCDDSDCNGEPVCGTRVEDCGNGLDDDNDGLVDCLDLLDCTGDPACIVLTEDCNDGTDNDGDSLVDCDDMDDCLLFPTCDYGDGDCCEENGTPGCDNDLGEDCACALSPDCCGDPWSAACIDLFVNTCGGTCTGPTTETECTDEIDNDNDTLVDCDDADCDTEPACLIPSSEVICDDGLDDDQDGFTDCLDTDCLGDAACFVPEICNDALDNDGDGFTDCLDTDCQGDPTCPVPEICNDSVDNDFDSAIDCDDIDCYGDTNCPQPEICNDTFDNDFDGDIDCNDSDCTFDGACDAGDGDCCNGNTTPGCSDEPGEDCVCIEDPYCCNTIWDGICVNYYTTVCGGTCASEDCSNGLDDDTDGDVDCDDSDCANHPDCAVPTIEVDCTDGVDNDQDTFTDCDDPDCIGTTACLPTVETDCSNNLDDDFDGDYDCADSDCATAANCITGGETNCADGLDDDADGLIDCDDPDCVLDPNCNVFLFESNCANAVDDDFDGDVDCDDSDCSLHPTCNFPPESACANGIDDDADGYTDCNDPDCVTDPNCATGETLCADGLDDDGDGDIDCDDNDCATDVNCITTGICAPIGNLECGDVVNGSNDMSGSTNLVNVYCSYHIGGWTGPEVSWVFTPDADGLVEVTLSELTADLDIQASNQADGCDPEDCEASGWNPPPQDEFMDWQAQAGTPYYIIIDGWQGAISEFTMTVECTPDEEVSCSNGIDDDFDGDTDCSDIDCLGDPSCPELDCTDGIDNDADAQIDCSDPDCYVTPTCLPELNCVDGLDDDLDGDTDCDDSDCAGAPACLPELDCSDGLDNDGDTDIDCDDSDCVDAGACGECQPVDAELGCGDVHTGTTAGATNQIETYCTSGSGYDGNERYFSVVSPTAQNMTLSLFALSTNLDVGGLLSDPGGDGCTPSNCVGWSTNTGSASEEVTFPVGANSETFVVVDSVSGQEGSFALAVVCTPAGNPEICDDGLDNDLDGDEDCFDPDCSAFPGCSTETVCDDGFDNDADGLADCNDSDCEGEPGCPEVIFSSVDDDPADFVVVDDGSHSSNTDWEIGVPNTATQGGAGPSSPYNGSTSWCTGCSNQVVSGGRFQQWITAQPQIFDLGSYTSGTLVLSWYHWQESPTWPNIDLARVDASSDGGNSTVEVWGPAPSDTGGWDYVEVDLTGYLGGDLTFAFHYDSLFGFWGGQTNADGWYIDDVQLIWYP